MGNRQRLRDLRPPDSEFSFLGDDEIGIKMKTCQVVAHEERTALAKRADVKFRGRTLVKSANLAHRYSLAAHRHLAPVLFALQGIPRLLEPLCTRLCCCCYEHKARFERITPVVAIASAS